MRRAVCSAVTKPIEKQTTATPDFAESLGYKNLSFDNIQDLQIDFLETMRDLWPFTLRQHFATQRLAQLQSTQGYTLTERDFSEVNEIKEDEKKVLQRANDILKIIVWMRFKLLNVTIENEKVRTEINYRCADSYKFFVNYFCWMHEPRMPHPLPAKIPFILYPGQEKMLDSMEMCLETRQNGIMFKSRGAGGSWGFCALEIHHWKYRNEYRSIMGSETEEKVDVLGSSNPLFGKLRYLIYNCPRWWRPTTFEVEGGPNDNKRHLKNPDNGSEIVGEIGESIGRSGRATRVIIDEAQELTHPEAIDFSLEDVPISRVDVGTARGMNAFGEKIRGGKIFVHEIGWEVDPRKNPDWRRGTKTLDCPWRKYVEATRDAVVIAQEYDRNLQASVEDAFIDPTWIAACVDFELPAEGQHSAGFDIAAGGANHSVYTERKGPVLMIPQDIPFRTPTEALLEAIDRGETSGIELMNYDGEGVGRSATGELKIRERPPKFSCNAVLGQVPASERYIGDEGKRGSEKFRNLRAELWWNFRERARKTYEHRRGSQFYSASELLSLPNHRKLIDQLCQPKRVWTGSRIGVESKQEMRTRGVHSPDFADSAVLAFADCDDKSRVIDQFDYTVQKNHVRKFTVDHDVMAGHQYAVVVQTEDMVTSVLCCWWWSHGVKSLARETALLQVYGEIIEPNALPEDILSMVRDKMRPHVKPIKEWIANDDMFSDFEKGRVTTVNLHGLESPARMYRKQGVVLKRNMLYDERASIMLVNRLFENGMIELHPDCEELSNQLRTWRIHAGRPESRNLGLATALCLLVTRLRKIKEITDEHVEPKYDGRRAGIGYHDPHVPVTPEAPREEAVNA